MHTVVIDPGHGGHDRVGGSSPNNATGQHGTLEKDLTLALSILVYDRLMLMGHRAFLTRATDRNMSLSDRAKLAHNVCANAFLSIHLNGWRDEAVQGTETYIHQRASTKSKAFADCVQSSTVAATGLRDRGVKTARFGVLSPRRHWSDTVAALLEVSFLTDPAEERRLMQRWYRSRIAEGIANGIKQYFDHG